MGLEKSEHIGRIVVDPRDSRVVWVAAYGPLWSSGGERGVYRTDDFGATWKQMFKVSDDTGIADILLDPRDPDTIYAAAHQRRRHVWTLVGGGPESALHKSVDGGKSWRKLDAGMPKGDIGRIGLALSPQNPDVLYAIVEAEADQGGFFRSADRGESWEKRAPHSTSGNYYTELFADPHQFDRVYSMDTFLQVSDDGGKSFHGLGEKSKHVDNHVIWVDPKDADHYLVGCDGGLYESFDRAATWRFFENLPITQFYRVGVDTALPFYNVCGGTQDNFSLCGPSRTRRFQGPANEDWEVAQGGDGFWTVADPTDPTSSTPRPSTACSPASTGRAARTSTSSRNRAPARRRCAGTGTRRWCFHRIRRPASTSPPTGSSAVTTAATAGRRSRPISRASSTATS